ncbi:DUF4367 domain-containing protein [Paenibacillaceae bacterium]|nr:DUF4367 domain-containing protein [Paenibacillaceae bacterium]
MEVNKEKFDKLFEEAFDEAAKNSTNIPDFTSSWEQIESKVRRKKSNKKIKTLLPIAAASFVLGAFLFGSPSVTKALDPFFNTVKTIQKNVVSFVFGAGEQGESGALTPPPDDGADTEENIELSDPSIEEISYASWEEALNHLSFSPIQFDYIPIGYNLSEVRLYLSDNASKADEARLVYLNDDNERLLIKLSKLAGSTVITSSHVQGDGAHEMIKINDRNAYYFAASSGHAMLEFLYEGLHIAISGQLEKEALIQIAENIAVRRGR